MSILSILDTFEDFMQKRPFCKVSNVDILQDHLNISGLRSSTASPRCSFSTTGTSSVPNASTRSRNCSTSLRTQIQSFAANSEQIRHNVMITTPKIDVRSFCTIFPNDWKVHHPKQLNAVHYPPVYLSNSARFACTTRPA